MYLQEENDIIDTENKDFVFTFLNTNARSLSPKINSLIDCFDEMDAAFGVVTETWLSDGTGLSEDIEDYEAGAGMGMLTRNRERGARGVSHGGVALIYHLNKCAFKEVSLQNPENF